MRRFASRTLQTLLDVSVLVAAYTMAFVLRFEWNVPDREFRRLVITLPYVIALQYFVLGAFGVPRFAWRYIGLREVTRILYAMMTATALAVSVRLIAPHVMQLFRPAEHGIVPTGVLLINALLGTFGICGVRMIRRISAERAGKLVHREDGTEFVPTLLVGAGGAGVQVAKEIEARPDLGMLPVGFVDDDPMKVGTVLHGIPVLGTTHQLVALCRQHRPKQALITIARASGKDVRRIVKLCEEVDVPVKIIPSIHEIVGGRVNLSKVRNVAIEDLLGREQVRLDEEAISNAIRGRAVLVTGAGGSIGTELCRQVAAFGPERLVLVERAENALFEIHRELIERFPNVTVVPTVGDVCDGARMLATFTAHKPSLVFHAAAHKHVPMMELNPGEAIKNNVFGTRVLADLSERLGVSCFVMISTDKAVNPTSIMGATKRIAELYIQALSQRSETRFLTVRFGNVLGSAGSVVPIFQQQIARGGPVTVTHADMKRYFMTIAEASQLVLQAGTLGVGGEIFILDMGEPMRILDLAHDLIRLSGLRPGEDIEVRVTGVRPGEKLFEELSVADECADRTRHPKIFVGRLKPPTLEGVVRHFEPLGVAAEAGDLEAIRRRICHLVPEFQPRLPSKPERTAESAPVLRPAVMLEVTR